MVMQKWYLLLPFFCLWIAQGAAQRVDSFSMDPSTFLVEFEEYLGATDNKDIQDLVKNFSQIYTSWGFNEEFNVQMAEAANIMLDRRMSRNPYFKDYISACIAVSQADSNLVGWHTAVLDLLHREERNKNVQDFWQFSQEFYQTGALRSSELGTSWYALGSGFRVGYENQRPYIEFPQVDLLARRNEDSIRIANTTGRYYPLDQIWSGEGGEVNWYRFGDDMEIKVELEDYEIDTKRSIYDVETAKLFYPQLFGQRIVQGSFQDKLAVDNPAIEGSYPRFESSEHRLQIDGFGEGLQYRGGFRLEGLTIYGYGTKENPAVLRILEKGTDRLVFRGASQLFTFRREERALGEGVNATFFFGSDSIYHPSVNIDFDIEKEILELTRGKRGSDRNPFFSSLHGVNIDVDKIIAYFQEDSVVIGKRQQIYSQKDPVHFESLKYFNQLNYDKLQGLSGHNPLAIIKVTAEKEGSEGIDANLIAQRLNSRWQAEDIESLLYQLVAEGFINYDATDQVIEVKDKVFHYVDANEEKVDYDVLNITSDTDSINALLNLNSKAIEIWGVENIELSAAQMVGMIPDSGIIKLQNNRNLDFDGKIFGGFTTIEGKDFQFQYEPFQIRLDSIKYFELFIPEERPSTNPKTAAYSVDSRIENLSGVLLIDAPSNKSGRENIELFPSLETKTPAYVFYERKDIQDSVYVRDSFYFQLDPFSFNRLDDYVAEDVHFTGTLFSAFIFPDIQETLVYRAEDNSLGFVTETPAQGYPLYQDKGAYQGEIDLSNQGLLGNGNVRYLGASLDAEDVVFRPQQLTARADLFELAESREEGKAVPAVYGDSVTIDWRPYRDSMFIRSKEDGAFDIFQSGVHTFDGTLVLTPEGLKGDGILDWPKAELTSPYFTFGANSSFSDTSAVRIKALEEDASAVFSQNVQADVDFDDQMATFKANTAFLRTNLPYNQYVTTMNEFDWDMSAGNVNFKSDETKLGKFTSTHPDQDSLNFRGRTAFYDLNNYDLFVGEVPYIITADAYVYPDSGEVFIEAGGFMTTLENARIVADTMSKYHVINRATVDIKGRRNYQASGFYEYNIGNREQEFQLDNIVGAPVGKGAYSEKAVATRAKGDVAEADSFYIDHKTQFRGTISLFSENANLFFDGFARLDADKLTDQYWFTINSEGDKTNLAIKYDSPRTEDGIPLRTGIFVSRENTNMYPRIMQPLFFRKDRAILPVEGIFKYDENKDAFIFGDSAKVLNNDYRGNQIVFNNQDGTVKGEGVFNIGEGLNYLHVDASGYAETIYEEIPDSLRGQTPFPEVRLDLMAGIEMPIPNKLINLLIDELRSSSFATTNIPYLSDVERYRKKATMLFPGSEKEVRVAIEGLSSGYFDLSKKVNPYTFLLTDLEMTWDKDYQSMVNVENEIGLVAVGGELIDKKMEVYIEFKMPSNGDDRLYLLIKSPSGLKYYFGYKQGIMDITSDDTRFMDAALDMKKKDLVLKMDDGENLEIQIVEPSKANLFLRRIQAVRQANN